jgi:hypothetical protein
MPVPDHRSFVSRGVSPKIKASVPRKERRELSKEVLDLRERHGRALIASGLGLTTRGVKHVEQVVRRLQALDHVPKHRRITARDTSDDAITRRKDRRMRVGDPIAINKVSETVHERSNA